MFNSKKLNNKIDNDFDIDSDLDFDDLDFSTDPFKDDREPVTKIKDGLVRGVQTRASDDEFITGVLKELLPKGYGDTLDFGDKVATSARRLYNDAANEVRPAVKDFKRIAAKLVPRDKDFVPDKVKEILKQWEEEAKSGEDSAGDLSKSSQREAAISLQLGEIFKEQFIKDEKDKREADSKDLIKESIELNRHRDVFTVLNQSAISLSRLSQYQTTVNLQYQKKSLELQHRQLFAQYDILETITKTHTLQADALGKIVKNTALPDWQKIKMEELTKQGFFNKFSGAVSKGFHGLFPTVDEYLQLTARRIRDRIMGAVKENATAFRSGLTEAEMAKEQFPSDMVDPYDIGGELAGTNITNYAGYKLAKKLKEPLKKVFPSIDELGSKLENFNEDLVGKAESFRTSSKWSMEEGPRAWIMRGLQSILPSIGIDKSFNRISGKDLGAVQPFTLKTERSINEIIPGYLSRILQEVQIMRTGNAGIDRVEYDQDKGRFTSSKKILKDIAGRVYDDANARRTNEIMDTVVAGIDPENKLSKEEKVHLKERLFRNKMQSKSLYAGLSAESRELTEKHINDLDSKQQDKLIFNRRLNSLLRNMRDPRSTVEKLISEGRQNELVELGIINRTSDGYELNMETFYKGQLGHGRYDALYKKNKGRVRTGTLPPSVTTSPDVAVTHENKLDCTDNFNSVIDRLDTSITYYKEIVDLIKELSNVVTNKEQRVGASTQETTDIVDAAKAKIEKAKKALSGGKAALLGRLSLTNEKYRITDKYTVATKKLTETIKRLGDDWNELYIKSEKDPRISKAKLRAGHYVDVVTNKVITSTKDIKGAVKDITNGQVVITIDELKDAIGKNTSKLKETLEPGLDKTKNKIRDAIPQKFSDVLKGIKERWKELYVKGEKDPRIIKAKLTAGHYADVATGKVLTALTDIKGSVKDLVSDTVILKAEELEDTYVKNEDGTFKRFYDYVKNTAESLYAKLLGSKANTFIRDTAAKAWSEVKDTASMFKSIAFGQAKDVWVQGENAPRMTAAKMQQGHYTDAVSGKPIYVPGDIQGEVKDEKGQTVVSMEELDRLMVFDSNQKRFAPIRKFLRGLGSIGKGIGWYYKKIGIPLTKFNFKMLAKATAIGVNAARWAFDGGPYSISDVYVGSEPEPRMYATKIKNGEYFNKSDGKPIYHQDDINGEVVDKDGKTVLFDEDFPNLKVYSSYLSLLNPFKPLKWIFQKTKKAATWTIKQGLKATKFLTRNIGKAALGITAGFIRYISKPEDVYVKGETTPRLKAILMKAGRYVSEKTGKIISLISDIDGPVWDQEEQIRVVDKDDIEKGLVGQNGEPIKTTVLEDVLTGIKKVNKLFSRRTKLNVTKYGTPNVKLDVKGETTGEQTVSLLGDIKNLFEDYFTEKKVKGDTDQDGDREGSWEDIKQRRDAAKAQQQKGATTEKPAKGKEKKDGLMGILATALDAITGFLGGFKNLFKAGGVLGGLGKLLGLGRAAGAVATAAGGMGTLGTIGAGLAAVVSSPVTLGIVGAAVAGYGAYKGYNALKRWMSKPSTLDLIRYTQYGFKKDNTSYFNKIVDLEEYMKQFVKIGSEQATIDEKKMDIDEMMSIFGMSHKDNEHKRIYGTWYIKRFKPVYLTHVSALNMINGSTDLSKINDLKKEEKLKYIEATKFSSGPYTVTTLPVLDGSVTAANATDVAAAVEAALKEFATQPGGSKPTGTALPTDSKKPEDVGTGGRLDYGKTDAMRKLPGASVAGSSAIGAAFASNAVSAFDTVRFKTYGLKELEKGKVVSLIMLESLMAKKVTYQGTKASFDGNPNELLEKVTTYFGIPDLFSEAAAAWTKWFRDRFLPVYLNYATLHMQATNKPPKADSAPVLDANQQYDIALALSATGGVWRVGDSPWEGYELNTNPDTVKGNLDFLKSLVKKRTLTDQELKQGDTNRDPNAPALKSPVSSAFASKTAEAYSPTSVSGSTAGTSKNEPVWDRINAGTSVDSNTGGMLGDRSNVSTGAKPTGGATDEQRSKEFADNLIKNRKYVMPPRAPGSIGPEPSAIARGSLLDYIGKKESNGNYNILVGGKTEPGLTNLTVAQVLDYQKGMKARGHESTAVGKYQIIRGTLEGLVKAGYASMDDLFSPKTQDRLAMGLLKIRGMDSFLSGKITKEQFADNLSKEWASLPYKTGASYYAGVGSNKSSGSREEFVSIIHPNNIGVPGVATAAATPEASPSGGIVKALHTETPKSTYSNAASPATASAAESTPSVVRTSLASSNPEQTNKSAYNPSARPAVVHQQAVRASKQATTPLSDALGVNPRVAGVASESANAAKNTLAADMMKNTESILSQSLNVHKETLDVMKMIYEKINNIKSSESTPPKGETKQYEPPKAPVPMRKSA